MYIWQILVALALVWLIGLCWIVAGQTKRIESLKKGMDSRVDTLRKEFIDLEKSVLEWRKSITDLVQTLQRRVERAEQLNDAFMAAIESMKQLASDNQRIVKDFHTKATEVVKSQELLDGMFSSIDKSNELNRTSLNNLYVRLEKIEDRLSNAVGVRVDEETVIEIGLEASDDGDLMAQYQSLSNDFAAYREMVIQDYGSGIDAIFAERLLAQEEKAHERVIDFETGVELRNSAPGIGIDVDLSKNESVSAEWPDPDHR